MTTDRGPSTMSNYDESASDRLSRKARESPFMIVGLCGLVSLVGYGIYGFRTKKIKTSLYLIHLRMAAQGFVVTSLTVGVAFNLFNRFVLDKKDPASIEAPKDQRK